jgi:nitrogen fixation NifU-like protein
VTADLRELYQEVILDHNRRPHHFHAMDDATRQAEGFNPLCGDTVTVFLKLQGEVITDVSFEGSGCAISKASASMMTDAIMGKTVAEVEALFDRFHRMVTSDVDTRVDAGTLGKLGVFAGVREFPARVKCASLVWHTLLTALAGQAPWASADEA